MKKEQKEKRVKYVQHFTEYQYKELIKIRDRINRKKRKDEYHTSLRDVICSAGDALIKKERLKLKKTYQTKVNAHGFSNVDLKDLTIIEPDSGEIPKEEIKLSSDKTAASGGNWIFMEDFYYPKNRE